LKLQGDGRLIAMVRSGNAGAFETIVDRYQGRLLGFCKLVLGCAWPEYARAPSVIELKQLYTDPDVTGRGIGAALMDWALAQAESHGAGEVQLSVWSGNHGAQRFYSRYGFGKVADIHFMVGNQRDEEFLFAKVL